MTWIHLINFLGARRIHLFRMHPGSFVSNIPAKEQGTQEDEATFHHTSAFRSGVFSKNVFDFSVQKLGKWFPFGRVHKICKTGSFKHHRRVGWPLSLCLTWIPRLAILPQKSMGSVPQVFVVKGGGEICDSQTGKKTVRSRKFSQSPWLPFTS